MIFKKTMKKDSLTVNSVSLEWLEANKGSYKVSTYQAYQRIVNKHIAYSCLGNVQIQRITQTHISDFKNKLIGSGLSDRTINDIPTVLKSILRYSNECYETRVLPVSLVKETKKEMRVLSVREQRILEHDLKNGTDIYKFAILLALYTGMRIGEICALQWKDMSDDTINVYKTMHRLYDDNGSSKIFIDSPKTANSIRIIPYPVILKPYIDKFRGAADEYVLSTAELKKIEPRLLQLKFKKIMDNCNFEGVTFHTLRHTFSTRCVECGFDIKTLSEILGHSDVKTTLNKYVHSSMDLKRSNMEKLSGMAL